MIRQWITKIDWLLLLLVIALSVWGLIALKSVSLHMIAQSGKNPYLKQFIFVFIGIFIALITANISVKTVYKLSWAVYFITVFLLVVVLVAGKTGYGATRWIRIFGIQFQPSEFAKVAALLALARYLSDIKEDINSFKVFIISGLIVFFPWALIFLEPDLGTSLVFFAFFFPVLYWGGFKPITIMMIVYPLIVLIATSNTNLLIASFVLLLIILYFLALPKKWKLLILLLNIGIAFSAGPIWGSLKPYQQKRIITFLDPSTDPRGAGYQVIQSMVTIGSGGLYGQGFKNGSQTQLGFIPEQHTDFIFTALGEEFGFAGVISVLLLFLFVVWRIIWIARNGKTTFTGLINIGIATIISFHVLVNIGMTLGVMPVTGLPLPFLSFGRSSLASFYLLIGLSLNFYKNRLEY
jgi:rod shape determining protein RodA